MQMADGIQRVRGMLGFATKAGKLRFGADTVLGNLRGRDAPCLVLTTADASENTKKRVHDKCGSAGVRFSALPLTSEEAGHITGRAAPVAVIGVYDEGFASLISPEQNELKGM